MDRDLRLELLLVVIGILVGGGIYLINASYLWNTTMAKEKSDISEGIYLDIAALEDTLVYTDGLFLNNTNEKYIYIQPDPFYTSNGVYFSYHRDIPKLDRPIATSVFAFYNHLLLAERYRNNIYEIQRKGDVTDITISELKQQQMLTKSVAYEVNTSVGILKKIKPVLDAAT